MEHILTQSNITFVIGLVGILFGVYHYFRNPQIKADKTDAILLMRFDNLESNFNNLKDNHLHTLGIAIETTNKHVNTLAIEVAKLSTIIDERVPKLIKYENK